MGDSIYNAKRNEARKFLQDNKNKINFKPTKNHKLSDIEKEIKKLKELPVDSTKLHNLEFRAKILRRGITNVADLESQMLIDENFQPKSGTGADYMAAQIIHDDAKDNTFEIIGDIGKEVRKLINKARNDAEKKQRAEAREKATRERREAEARRVSSSSSLSSSSNDPLNSWTKKRRRVEFGELAREFLPPVLFDELRWKHKEATTKEGLVYALVDQFNPNKIKLGCSSFLEEQRLNAFSTSTAFPAYMKTRKVDNKWELERKFLDAFKEYNIRNMSFDLPPLEPEWNTEKQGGTELFWMPIGSPQRALLFKMMAAYTN